ncbi:hypothetical protein [Conchiformibius kuhniae]|uniref:Uncharacterized protein n=1 Tax=Conchiformibius kuhniae TaxID=211502 RepID=A0A8T9MR32_9NEIS|nr:hypothetical protein [Conchiformibius kuhniae]UOP04350.1 hypothetical protein LVJ77_08360 [Conchiformibius kuhniae]
MHTLPQEIINNLKTRRMTDDDFAFLKSLPDFHEIDEIYFFDDYFIQSGRNMVEISDTEKLFELGDIPGLTVTSRYVYVNGTDICIIIDAFVDYSIYFCSQKLRNNLDDIKKIFSYLIVKFGHDLDKNYEVTDEKLENCTFIESRNQYFDY